MTISPEELKGIYDFAVQLAKDAGKILLERAEGRYDGVNQEEQKHVEKVNAVDLVTQTDEDVEAFIKGRITEKYPSHKFVSPRPKPFYSNSISCY